MQYPDSMPSTRKQNYKHNPRKQRINALGPFNTDLIEEELVHQIKLETTKTK